MVKSISVPDPSRLQISSLPSAISARSFMPCKPKCPSRLPALRTCGSMPLPIIPDAKPELLFLIPNTRCHDGNPPHPELAAFAKEQGYEVSNDGLLLTI